MSNKVFKTVIKNDTEGKLHLAVDFLGDRYARLNPGQEGYVLGTWWNCYSPYSKVVYKKNGTVKAIKRIGFRHKWKDGQYVLKITNLHDAIENYKIGSLFSLSFIAPKGITIEVPVDPRDPLADWESIVVHPDKITRDLTPRLAPAGILPGQIQQDRRGEHRYPNLKYVKRSNPELQKLEEVRHQLKIDDPDGYKFYDRHQLWNRSRWKVSPEMLLTPEEKQRIEEAKKRRLENEQAYENYR